MRYFSIIITGQAAATQLTLPTAWEEITLAQYIRLVTEPDTHPLNILTALSAEQVQEAHGGDIAFMLGELTFLQDSDSLLALQPSSDLPDVGSSSYGQLLLANQYASERVDKPQLLCAPYFYALYRSQQLAGKYDETKLEKLLAATLASPVTDVWADVVFIWAAWQLSTSAMLPMKTTWTTTPMRNTRQE